jgi:thermostable 8-oxoguanine DNA glycosylase
MGEEELQARLIYSIIVAGKSARFTETVMRRLHGHAGADTLFDMIRRWIAEDALDKMLRDCRTGNYTKLAKALRALVAAEIDLSSVLPEQLETIHGIGPKTSRFFVLWTRPGVNYAALDVHVLRWLKKLGHNAPRSTPTGAKYRELELIFLEEAKKRGMTARELDAQIWDESSGYASAQAQQQFETGGG